MNPVNQGSNHDAPPIMPVKRKRGRPRKDQSLVRRTDTPAPPPGFRLVNGNQHRQLLAIEGANANANPSDSIVGQAVTGVVEGTFDAGYLLAVRIGNSNTSLRGVVFKPGHFVPISSENDVAPHVQTIRRNEIPLPMASQTRVRGRRPKSRERIKQHSNIQRMETSQFFNGFPPGNQVQIYSPQAADLTSSKGKQVVPVSAYSVPSVGSRGLVVPVVLQPVSLSNGFPPSYQMPPFPSQPGGHSVVLNHKPVQTTTTQVESSQPQITHQLAQDGGQNGPMPDLQSCEIHIQNSTGTGKSSAEDSGLSGEGDSDTSEPLSVEPLQTIHTIRYQSGPVNNPPEINKIGRMSELLQALQDNMVENHQVLPVENKATGNEGSGIQLSTPMEPLP